MSSEEMRLASAAEGADTWTTLGAAEETTAAGAGRVAGAGRSGATLATCTVSAIGAASGCGARAARDFWGGGGSAGIGAGGGGAMSRSDEFQNEPKNERV